MDLYGIVVLAFPYRKMLHWVSLFHRHAGERESGGNVRRRQWACLNFNQGDFVRDWSKPCEALLDEFDFRRCHLFVHFLTARRDLTLRASVTVVSMFILQACSTCPWYRANVAARSFCIVCIWLG